jgi:hypothetical protein
MEEGQKEGREWKRKQKTKTKKKKIDKKKVKINNNKQYHIIYKSNFSPS